VLLTAITEALSIFHSLTFGWLLIFWGLAALVSFAFYYYPAPEKKAPITKDGAPIFLKLLLGGVAVIASLTFLIAAVSPPNNYDSMTYHMARVAHWIQNQSVAHYPTHILRQLQMPPWAEFAITNLQILNGGDYLANLVQWFSMVGCVIGVTLIAKGFNAGLRGQVFAAVVCAAIPMGILQSSSTQNDYVVSFWLLCLVYFIQRFRDKENWNNALCIGASLGLALLTKGTAYIYAFPFILYLGLYALKKLRTGALKYGAIIVVVALAIATGHYSRNYSLTGSPLGTGQESEGYVAKFSNEAFTPSVFLSNVSRNIATQLTTPSERINKVTYSAVKYLHTYLGLDINDRRATWPGAYFVVQKLYFSENYDGNPLHFIMIVFSLVFIVSYPRLRRVSPVILTYNLLLASGFLFFCFYLKWQPWNSRLHLPLFVLWSPAVGLVLSEMKLRRFADLTVVFLLMASIPWVFNNDIRPLTGENPILTAGRSDIYFNTFTEPKLKDAYKQTANLIAAGDCKDIGLVLEGNSVEYPFWVLLNAGDNKKFRIEHINVTGRSNNLSMNRFSPCASVSINNEGKASVSYLTWDGRYSDGWTGKKAKLKIQGYSAGELAFSMPSNSKILNEVLPLYVSLTGGNDRSVRLTIEKGRMKHGVDISRLITNGSGEINIEVSRTWRPADLGISNDTRTLGVRVDYRFK
jgi:4-amino-4-deoxy-L-arabinose transferase-like glycosyltransferase